MRWGHLHAAKTYLQIHPCPSLSPNVPPSRVISFLAQFPSRSTVLSPTLFHSVLLFLTVMVMTVNMIFASMKGTMMQTVEDVTAVAVEMLPIMRSCFSWKRW